MGRPNLLRPEAEASAQESTSAHLGELAHDPVWELPVVTASLLERFLVRNSD